MKVEGSVATEKLQRSAGLALASSSRDANPVYDADYVCQQSTRPRHQRAVVTGLRSFRHPCGMVKRSVVDVSARDNSCHAPASGRLVHIKCFRSFLRRVSSPVQSARERPTPPKVPTTAPPSSTAPQRVDLPRPPAATAKRTAPDAVARLVEIRTKPLGVVKRKQPRPIPRAANCSPHCVIASN